MAAYPGEHQSILPLDLLNRVQRGLAELRPPGRASSRAIQDAALAGLLFDETGVPMPPTYTVKGGEPPISLLRKQASHEGRSLTGFHLASSGPLA